MRTPLAAVLLLAAASASAATPSGALSTSTQTVSSLYTGDRVRDPFLPPSMGTVGVSKRVPLKTGEAPPPVDIHSLHLRGVLKDGRSDFALFSADGGGTLMLRGGRLFDERGKPAPGITGKILIKQKTVQLITPDKDVQIFRLGEVDEEKDKRP